MMTVMSNALRFAGCQGPCNINGVCPPVHCGGKGPAHATETPVTLRAKPPSGGHAGHAHAHHDGHDHTGHDHGLELQLAPRPNILRRTLDWFKAFFGGMWADAKFVWNKTVPVIKKLLFNSTEEIKTEDSSPADKHHGHVH